MASCILPDWVRWASSTKTNRLPLAVKSLGILAFSSAMKSASASSRALVVVGASELVDQRADQPRSRSGSGSTAGRRRSWCGRSPR